MMQAAARRKKYVRWSARCSLFRLVPPGTSGIGSMSRW
jgi:hypothetical protein